MNYLAAKAEMAVRTCRWGEGCRECVTIVADNFFNRLEERAEKQVEDRKRMMIQAARRRRTSGHGSANYQIC
jgi:hypothetical protein